jgi:hypothetical protein
MCCDFQPNIKLLLTGRANNVGEWMSGSTNRILGMKSMSTNVIHNTGIWVHIIGSVMGIAVVFTYRFEDLSLKLALKVNNNTPCL